MDSNQLAAVGFYFTNQSDVFRCAFCLVEDCLWKEIHDALKEHQRWMPFCDVAKVLCAGNFLILFKDQPDKSPE
jgi:hypothetical protein